MARCALSPDQLKAIVLSELFAVDAAPADPRDLIIVGKGSGWRPTLRPNGPRLDETLHATVCEIGRRLAAGYDLAV